ncbi:hypothetical protein DVJ82_005900 [Escherichia coli]|nr:hypothetical protein DVJ82_005900 [Escherichia coli]
MNQFLKRTFRTLNKPSEGRKTFQPLGEPTRLSTSIFCENKDAHKSLDSPLVYVGAHNIRYVKSCLSDAKCFSGSRYSFRVQELKPLLFHNWPVHGEIAWLFPAPC